MLEVTDYSIDLFEHRLREDLDLDPDLDGGNLPAANLETGELDRVNSWNNLPKGAVASTSFYAPKTIFVVHDALSGFDLARQPWHLPKAQHVLVELRG
jgi:hypothetical protein